MCNERGRERGRDVAVGVCEIGSEGCRGVRVVVDRGWGVCVFKDSD